MHCTCNIKATMTDTAHVHQCFVSELNSLLRDFWLCSHQNNSSTADVDSCFAEQLL